MTIKSPGVALLGASGSGSLKKLQSSCWLKTLAELEDLHPNSFASFFGGKLQFLITCCFYQCKWSVMEAAAFINENFTSSVVYWSPRLTLVQYGTQLHKDVSTRSQHWESSWRVATTSPFTQLFTHSLICKYSLSSFYVAGTLLNLGGAMITKTDVISTLLETEA